MIEIRGRKLNDFERQLIVDLLMNFVDDVQNGTHYVDDVRESLDLADGLLNDLDRKE